MFFYGLGFLAFILGAVPLAFYQIDEFVPAIHVEIGTAARSFGGGLFVVALLMYIMVSYVLTSCGKGAFVEFDPPKELVVVGPYRYVRNPVVACLLITMVGEAIAASSTGMAIMVVVIAGLAHLQVTRIEEPLLEKRFGDSYLGYCAHVPRWIPKLAPYENPSESRQEV
jgi:protein-S-isoprenylcysteine O-methyltransferase Ste14